MVTTFLSKTSQTILQQQQNKRIKRILYERNSLVAYLFTVAKNRFHHFFSCQKHLSKNLSNHDRSQTFVSNSPNFTYLISLYIFISSLVKKGRSVNSFISRKWVQENSCLNVIQTKHWQ